jgi:hypothetical protein
MERATGLVRERCTTISASVAVHLGSSTPRDREPSMITDEHRRIERDGHVVAVTPDRPGTRNACSMNMWLAIRHDAFPLRPSNIVSGLEPMPVQFTPSPTAPSA